MQLDCGVATSQRRLAFTGNMLRFPDPKQACIGRNPCPLAGADEAVQRHALHSCGKIPQCDVEAGNREHRDAITAEQMQIALNAIHEGGNALSIRNFETSSLRRNHFIDRGGGRSWTHVAKGIAPAG